jgi:hypothetical protein
MGDLGSLVGSANRFMTKSNIIMTESLVAAMLFYHLPVSDAPLFMMAHPEQSFF